MFAAALRAGLWCAAIGVPDLGAAALADMVRAEDGPDEPLRTLLAVSDPGGLWPEVTATLADGVDLLLLRPTTTASPTAVRQITARLRQRGSTGVRHSAALAVLGRRPTARLTIHTDHRTWLGLRGEGPLAGTGHLTASRAQISAQGRATAGRRRAVEVWLPAPTGHWASIESAGQVRPLRRDAA